METRSVTIELKENVLQRAMELSEIESEEEMIKTALMELIERRKRDKLLKLEGAIQFYEDYDYVSPKRKARAAHDFG